MTELNEVVIVDYLRTPISRSRPTQPERDVFHEIPADILLSLVIKKYRNSFKNNARLLT